MIIPKEAETREEEEKNMQAGAGGYLHKAISLLPSLFLNRVSPNPRSHS